MQIAIVKLKLRCRRRIPRRPHPDLDYFFGRLEHADCQADEDPSSELADLDHPLPPRH